MESTLVDILRRRAENQSDRVAYIFLKDGEGHELKITYQELDRQARLVAGMLQELKAQGERVLLLYPPGLEYIIAFFGCLYAGAIAVPAYPPDPARLNRTLPRLQAIVKDTQAKITLTTAEVLNLVDALLDLAPEFKELQWRATDSLGAYLAERWRNPGIHQDDLAFLQYTSGSTATPKGVMLSHANIIHNERIIEAGFQHSEKTVSFGWLPFYHDMGLIGHVLQPVFAGFPSILMSPFALLKHPLSWLQGITRFKANTSGGPNFAYDLCVRKIKPEQREGLDLSSWNLAFCGAEPIHQQSLDHFAEFFKPCGFRREAFYPCYGLAEATLMVTGGQKSDPPVITTVKKSALQQNRMVPASTQDQDKQNLVGCGRAILGQTIAIADPKLLTRCSENQIGEIWISGPSVAKGYWKLPKETKQTFHAYLKDTGEGPFLRTGDLGFLKDGELFVTGRLKDVIKITGQNHYAQDIELTVEKSHPAIRRGCGAAFSIETDGVERLIIVQEINNDQPVDSSSMITMIRRAVVENHDVDPYKIVLIQPKTIFKTSSGKIQRQACRESFLSGALKEFLV